MFCRFGSDDDSRPVGGRGQRVAGVDALGLRIDVVRQRVGVGRAQLRHLPPVQNLLRQLVALLGQVFQHLRAGRPLAGLGLGAAGQAHLAEQDVAQLLRAAGIDRRAGELVDLVLEPGLLLRELAGQPRQHLAVDRDAAPLHARQHRHQRPLQRLVDGRDMLGRPSAASAPATAAASRRRPRRRIRRPSRSSRSRTAPATCRCRRPPRNGWSCGRATSRTSSSMPWSPRPASST